MQDDSKQEKPDEEVKKRAIKRVAAAAVLAMVAAVGLTMISYQKPSAPPAATPEPTAIPAEPAVSAVQAPAPVLPQVSAVAATPVERDAPPAVSPPPPPPQVVNVPQAPGESAHKAAKPAVMKPSKDTELATKPNLAIAPPVVEKSGKPRAVQELVQARETAAKASEAAAKASEMKKPAETQKIPETTKQVPTKPVPSEPQPPAPTSQAPKGYAVQLGVFSNPANAIQMQEKLSQNGIRSYTETKLNVGPFQNKAEAEQAMAKVRSLGLGAVVVPLR